MKEMKSCAKRAFLFLSYLQSSIKTQSQEVYIFSFLAPPLEALILVTTYDHCSSMKRARSGSLDDEPIEAPFDVIY